MHIYTVASFVGLCQSRENTVGGRICGTPIADYTQSLWTHLKSKHPQLWKELKGLNTDSGDAPTSAQPSELQSSTTLVCAVSVSYQQMVDTLSAAPPDTLTQAIEALEDARTRRIRETAESFVS